MSDDAATIVDIVLACRRIQRFIAAVDEARFVGNEEKRWAVVSQLMLIGEAARRLSEQFRAAHPEIAWPLIVGMRNRLVHDYDKIDWPVVWQAATRDVPRLSTEVEPLAEATRSEADTPEP